MKKIQLYYMPHCPYCRKVLKFMKDENIELELLDTSSDEKNKEDLIRIGGKNQVPCLVIDGEALYESMDIIQWLKDHKAEL